MASRSHKNCFFDCKGKLFFFGLPKEPSTRQKWLDTLFPGQEEKLKVFHFHINSVSVCSRHFEAKCFANLGQFKVGLAARPLLTEGSVPTILGRVDEDSDAITVLHNHTSKTEETLLPRIVKVEGADNTLLIPTPAVSTSEQKHTPIVDQAFAPCKVSRGTQAADFGTTKPVGPGTKNAATQLAYSTLKERVRSKASQASVVSQNASTQTNQLNSSSGPKFTERTTGRPSKKQRLEDTMNQRAESNSEQNGDQTSSTDTDGGNCVFLSRLESLLLTCPVCGSDCQIKTWRLGTYDSFIQLCSHCTYTRKWLGMEAESSQAT